MLLAIECGAVSTISLLVWEQVEKPDGESLDVKAVLIMYLTDNTPIRLLLLSEEFDADCPNQHRFSLCKEFDMNANQLTAVGPCRFELSPKESNCADSDGSRVSYIFTASNESDVTVWMESLIGSVGVGMLDGNWIFEPEPSQGSIHNWGWRTHIEGEEGTFFKQGVEIGYYDFSDLTDVSAGFTGNATGGVDPDNACSITGKLLADGRLQLSAGDYNGFFHLKSEDSDDDIETELNVDATAKEPHT